MERSYPPVLTKRDFTRRYAAGEFGNASPTWHDPVEFGSQVRPGLFHLRNRVAGGATHYDLPWRTAYSLWLSMEDPTGWYVSGMAPTEGTLIQGEVMTTPRGLYLYYTTVAKPMRAALAERAESVEGIIALSLLRFYLCPNSYEWLSVLLERYPGHVVEFSTYDREWGTIPGFNTVYWEVRQY